MSFGIWELGIILLIVALLFGTRKLGSMGGDLGNAIKGFRNAMKDDAPDKEAPAENSADGQVIDGEVEQDRPAKQPDS